VARRHYHRSDWRPYPVWVVVLIWLASMFAASLLGTASYDRIAKVQVYPPAHERDITTWQLNFGTDGIVTVLADSDLPFAKALHTKHVRVVLEPIEP
jgi:hypothetical protein